MTYSGVAARVVLTSALIAVGTWLVGCWAVPVLCLLAGGTLLLRPAHAAVAAGIAWAVLLIIDVVASAAFTRLSAMLAGVMGLPAIALIALTIALPMILAWSAASIGYALRSTKAG